jgi:hypothetical protein
MLRVFITLLFAVLSSAGWAADCTSIEAVAVDRSKFYGTVGRAVGVMKRKGFSAERLLYRSGSSRSDFGTELAALEPDIVVAHYSMFGTDAKRGKPLSELFDVLRTRAHPPVHFVVYSSAFRKGGETEASLRLKGYFTGIPDSDLTLVPVPTGNRFDVNRGDVELIAILNGLIGEGVCS